MQQIVQRYYGFNMQITIQNGILYTQRSLRSDHPSSGSYCFADSS